MTYDWRLDSYRCWELALRILRKQGIIQREIDPLTELERCLWL